MRCTRSSAVKAFVDGVDSLFTELESYCPEFPALFRFREIAPSRVVLEERRISLVALRAVSNRRPLGATISSAYPALEVV